MHNYCVVLINLKLQGYSIWETPIYSFEHLGLQYVAAELRNATYPTKIIDMESFQLSTKNVIEIILNYRPLMIGMSPTSATMGLAIDLAISIKKVAPDIHITLGGHHATFAANEILQNEACFDSIVRGEGEHTIIDLVRSLEYRQNLINIKGLWCRNEQGTVVRNPDRAAIDDLNSLRWPVRDVLEIKADDSLPLATRMVASRGCSWSCRFCTTPSMLKIQGAPKWRPRLPEDVVEELNFLIQKYNIEVVFFNDDDFIGPEDYGVEHAKRIAELILQRGIRIRFRVMLRASDLTEKNKNVLCTLTLAGMESVLVGIESGAASALRRYRKYMVSDITIRAAKFLAEENVQLQLGFIMFDPYTTFEELVKNLEILKRLNQLYLFKHLSIRMGIFPGTPMFNRAQQDDLLPSGNWYMSAYQYRFKDQRLAQLAETMEKIQQKVVKLDRLLFDLDLQMCRIRRGLLWNGFRQPIEAIQNLKALSSRLNEVFFFETIKRCAIGEDPRKQWDLINGFLKKRMVLQKKSSYVWTKITSGAYKFSRLESEDEALSSEFATLTE